MKVEHVTNWMAGLVLVGATAACDYKSSCNRQPASDGGRSGEAVSSPGTSDTEDAILSLAEPTEPPDASNPPTLAARVPDETPPTVEPLRPGPDDVDHTLLPRLQRHVGAAVKIEALVRSGDAWLVAYTWDEVDAWWHRVHRDGKVAEVRAELRRRRLACEAATRHRDEDRGGTTGDGGATGDDPIDDFDPDPEGSMDERSCWQRAVGSLAPRRGPFEEECHALAVARVTDTAIESLWSYTGDCVDAPAAFELVDLAGAGWPQLVLQVRAVHWDMTRVGFQDANTTARMVVLDPRGADDAEMLAEIVAYETHVDDSWQWEGSYAHVAFTPGRHVTVVEQTWNTGDACELDAAGWAVAEPGDGNDLNHCTVDWTVTRTPWDPVSQRWSGKAEILPRPKRMPVRARELPVALPGSVR